MRLYTFSSFIIIICFDLSTGLYKRADAVHEGLVVRFPEDPQLRVERAINFLYSNE